MSKYKNGAYHFKEYQNKNSPYTKHVDDVVHRVIGYLGRESESHVIDVGSGEGLVVKLLRDLGVEATGFEDDPHALKAAASVGMQRHVIDLAVHDDHMRGADAILYLDSLEHIPEWKRYLREGILSTNLLFIAVPDRHDKHAIRQNMAPDIEVFMEEQGWRKAHYEQRHARHFYIYENPSRDMRDGSEESVRDDGEDVVSVEGELQWDGGDDSRCSTGGRGPDQDGSEQDHDREESRVCQGDQPGDQPGGMQEDAPRLHPGSEQRPGVPSQGLVEDPDAQREQGLDHGSSDRPDSTAPEEDSER